MDGLPQRPDVDASLVFLRKLDEEPLSKKPKNPQRSLASSKAGSISTMNHTNAAVDRKRNQTVVSESSEDGGVKRVKIASSDQDYVVVGTTQIFSHYDVSQHLPAEVWHRIFCLVPPRSLGKLMRVNRLFHKYLDPASPFEVSAPASDLPSSLPKLSPDTIWRASRRFHWPSMPSPLSERSELDMWRLACSRSCQFCGRVDDTDYAGEPLPWSRRPGHDTVSPVFQFFVASCGQCLAKKSVKEVDLLLSASNPSFIAAGAPAVFLTADLNVVPRQIMQKSPIPTGVHLTKVFWPAQLESLQAELEDARRFGAAAVEEWIKGLESRGAEATRDASRWDTWCLSGGVRQMRRQPSSTQFTSSSNDQHQRDKTQAGRRATAPKKQATHKYSTRSNAWGIKAAELKVQEQPDSPIRAEISKLADRIINGQLNGGVNIKKKFAAFASQVLLCVRNQYYANSFNANPSLTQRLTLDDMRWVFNQKIAPLSDRPEAAIFSCNKCPTTKLYSFQGVVQHYCQIHCGKETKMSVHWRAEWAAELPFKSATIAEPQSLIQREGGDRAFKTRAAALAEDLAPAWAALKTVQHVPVAVKVSVAIHFIAKRYQEMYQEAAPWELLFTGKCYNIITVETCLACKVCKQRPTVGSNRTFKLAGLAHHFHQAHEHVDWRTGMVWVPDLHLSQEARAAIRKKRRAFELISDALPWLFDDDKEEMSQSDPVLSQSQQPPLEANQQANDAVAGPATHLYPTQKPSETVSILPASAVYSTPGLAHRQLTYKADIASGLSIDEIGLEGHEASNRIMARYSAREVEDRDGANREATHLTSRSVDSRHDVPESRGYIDPRYVRRNHEPHQGEPLVSYPYYPDMERQIQQIQGAVEVRHTSRQPYTTRYYNPPMPSTAASHYGEANPSRHHIVDMQNLPHQEYHEHSVGYHRQRAAPMPIIPTVPAGKYVDTEPASRVYSEYTPRHLLFERGV
ncbi:hypothetical protein HDV57DRAFT_521251 [Trichoderma longibrachiatum]